MAYREASAPIVSKGDDHDPVVANMWKAGFGAGGIIGLAAFVMCLQALPTLFDIILGVICPVLYFGLGRASKKHF